jgi:hypothetical protein
MIHRLLYTTLQQGVQQFLGNLSLLEDIFLWDYDLEQSEMDLIKKYFVEHPPVVINGYMRRDAVFPSVAIVLGQEQETDKFIGDHAGILDEENEEHNGADIKGSIWDYVYHIFIYTEHPDITAYYYEIMKAILILNLPVFYKYGLFDVAFSGQDLAPDVQYLPEHLFVRQLQMSCRRESNHVDQGSRLGKAYKVTGIAIDRSGSPRDPGEVKTLVTLTDPGGTHD